MQKILLLLSIALSFNSILFAAPSKPKLNSDSERKRIMDSYNMVMQPEPFVTDIEYAVMEKVISLVDTKPKDAYAMLTDMLESGKPMSPAFNHTLGNLYYSNNNFFLAETQFQAAIDKHPTFQRAWNGLGLTQYKQNNFEDAAKSLTNSVKYGANDPMTYGILGYCLLQLGHLKSAETAYSYAVLFEPEQTDWAEGIAQIYSDTGRHSEAIAVFDDLIRKAPENSEFWLLKANAWLSLDEPLKTARCIEIARKIDQVDVESLYLLGNIYLKNGLFHRAREAFMSSATSNGNFDSLELLKAARHLVYNDQFDFAREIFQAIENENESWAPAERSIFNLLDGDFKLADNKTSEAESSYLKALQSDPFNSYVLMKLADIKLQQDETDQAIIYFDRAAADPNNRYNALVSKSMALINQKKYSYALRSIEEALEINKNPRLSRLFAQVKNVVNTSSTTVN